MRVRVDTTTSVSRIHKDGCREARGPAYPTLHEVLIEAMTGGNCVWLCGICQPGGMKGCVCTMAYEEQVRARLSRQ